MYVLKWLHVRWRLIVAILIPLVLLPIPLVLNSLARCGYIVLILASYWISEALPLPVTSLLPLFLFPLAGILKTELVAQQYFKDTVLLFFGSMTFAYAVESVNLHRRIALFVLKAVGTSEVCTKGSMEDIYLGKDSWTCKIFRAMAGLMGVTAFLSMWINNSASTSIMVPVATAITNEFEAHSKSITRKRSRRNNLVQVNNLAFNPGDLEAPVTILTNNTTLDSRSSKNENQPTIAIVKTRFENHKSVKTAASEHEEYINLRKGFLISVAYASSIGGLSSLVGTGPNVVLDGFVSQHYGNTNFRINFVNFLAFALPVGVVLLVLCWFWLQIYYNRKKFFECRTNTKTRKIRAHLKTMLTQQYEALGSPSWSEITVAILFIVLVLLWITRDFPNAPGWSIIFEHEYITEATVAIFCGVLPLILPNSNPFNSKNDWKYEPIVQWTKLTQNLSWGAVFLIGAGFAVAEAFQKSKLSESVADAFSFLSNVPQSAVILIIIIISGLFTEVTSNVATANIFFPVLDSVASSTGIHPAFLILPCALAVSLAFMLPIATPPNAIVFSTGDIRVIDLIKTGVVMNLVGFLCVFLACSTWMPSIFGINETTTALFFNRTIVRN